MKKLIIASSLLFLFLSCTNDLLSPNNSETINNYTQESMAINLINENTIWSSDKILDKITIIENKAILTISKGVNLNFLPGANIYCYDGKIIAKGTINNWITFKNRYNKSGVMPYVQIYVSDKSEFEYCNFYNLYKAAQTIDIINNSNPSTNASFINCVFSNNYYPLSYGTAINCNFIYNHKAIGNSILSHCYIGFNCQTSNVTLSEHTTDTNSALSQYGQCEIYDPRANEAFRNLE
jgi:hypothetical protein